MNIRFSLSSIRMSAIAGVILCILISGFSVVRDPAILYPLRVGIPYLAVLVIVLLSYVILVMRLTHNSDADSLWIARRGFHWGIVIAGFWLMEIVTGNLIDSQHGLVKLIYFASTIFAFGLPLFAGIEASGETALITTGTWVGLWSGLVSGVLTFLCLMAVTYLFLNTMLQDPQNVLQFRESGAADMTTFVIGDSLAGAVGHLVIGLVLGPVFGAVGGLAGKVVARQASKTAI